MGQYNPENVTNSLPAAVDRARGTYDRPPKFHRSLLNNSVYKAAPELFARQVNAWDLYDGQGFIEQLDGLNLEPKDATFIIWDERDDRNGAATVMRVSSYIFDSRRNAVRVLDLQGQVHEIPVSQYGLASPNDAQSADSLRMRAVSNLNTGEDIEVGFTLVNGLPKDPKFITSTVNNLVTVTKTTENSNAHQRHADYYINWLMILDSDQDREKLDLEMGQIVAAVGRLQEEKVGSIFHLGVVDLKLKAASGRFVEKYISKLVGSDAVSKEDLANTETAIGLIESGKAKSSVSVEYLKSKLVEVRGRLKS